MPTLHFKGKTFLQNYHHSVKFHNLVAKKDKGLSKNPSLDDNLVIHGDNLKALKALLPTHAGKVKCIYIDPPYNTGNENWAYNDNVASPMIKEWLGKTVDKEDLTRHDKWCCMMYPRLTLLKELLQDDGVIFVSIDDNEIHHLRMIMDEIFGEENFITELIWKAKHGGGGDSPYVVKEQEYILLYAKKITELPDFFAKPPEGYEKMFRFTDKNGKYYLERLDKKGIDQNRPNLIYPIKCPDNTIKDIKPLTWRLSKEEFERRKTMGLVEFKKDKNDIWQIYTKTYLVDEKGNSRRVKPRSILKQETVGFTQNGNKEILEIFGKDLFDNPKPVNLIKYLLDIITHDTKDCLILDSFSGSGTTGHAVLTINKEDEGTRKFILIECEDYADQITAERIRRISKDLGGTFSYYELGEPVEIDNLLEGKNLPDYEDLAKYAFFMATGEKFNNTKVNQKDFYIGSSNTFEVFLIYSPDKNKLKDMALNLDLAEKINQKFPTRPKLIFAPACFMEDYHLKEFNIRFAQLPFEIYRMAE